MSRAHTTNGATGRRVAVIVDFLPPFRGPFFERLRATLAEHDVALTLIYGTPPEFELKPEAAVYPEWGHRINVRWFGIKGHFIIWHQGALRRVRGHDLVISHQASRSVVNYPLFVWSRLRGPRLALWGHGVNPRDTASGLGERLKRLMTRRAAHFFAYTNRSREIVIDAGVEPSRVTVVQNASDTSERVALAATITDPDLAALRAELGIESNDVAAYIGRFAPHRDPQEFLDVVVAAREALPTFEVVVIGGGTNDQPIREFAATHPWFHHVGFKYGRDLVMHQILGKLLMLPGPVGLSVLDAFAVGQPLVARVRDDHGPEYDYLTAQNALVLPASTTDQEFGQHVARLLGDPAECARLAAGAQEAGMQFTIDEMVRRFAAGVLTALDSPRR